MVIVVVASFPIEAELRSSLCDLLKQYIRNVTFHLFIRQLFKLGLICFPVFLFSVDN